MGIVPQLINVVRFVSGSWYTACALAKVSQIGNYIYTHILVSFLFFFLRRDSYFFLGASRSN